MNTTEHASAIAAFEQAIAESLPDEKLINSLKNKIKAGERNLKKNTKDLDKLTKAFLSGKLKKETISNTEQSLLEAKKKATEELEANREKLRSLPDVQQVKEEAQKIRRRLLEQFSGKERLEEMTFDEKKSLLHWLFDGKDAWGMPYGIYITKKKKGAGQEIDYFMYGKITGLRTLKGDDIDFDPESGTGGGNQGEVKIPRVRGSYKGKGGKEYKTYNRAFKDDNEVFTPFP